MLRKAIGRFNRVKHHDLLFFCLIAGIHILLAVYFKDVLGVDITANPRHRPWDWWWQTIPVDLLRNKLLESIWYLHAQPPLFNLYGAFFFRTFPQNAMSAMQYGNILLGSMIPGMYYLTLSTMTGKKTLSFGIGLLLALDPGLFLFEAYILYDLLTTVYVATSVCLFVLYAKTRQPRYAYLFMLVLNLLVLTRSAYHILILPIALALVFLVPAEKRRRALLVGALISLFSVGWYAKNYFMYGFFGASSWQGFSMWEITSTQYSKDDLRRLADEHIIDPMVAEVPTYSPLSSYQPYGFTQTSNIELLNRDDFHNINFIQIARVYQRSAARLILAHPKAYLRAALLGYSIYNTPSAEFRHHILNIEKIKPLAEFTSRIIQGEILDDYLPFKVGSFYYFLIPACLSAFAVYLAYRFVRFKPNLFSLIQWELPEIWMAFLITYTTLVGSFLEIGENNRERFYVEQLVTIFAILLIRKYILLFRGWGQRESLQSPLGEEMAL